MCRPAARAQSRPAWRRITSIAGRVGAHARGRSTISPPPAVMVFRQSVQQRQLGAGQHGLGGDRSARIGHFVMLEFSLLKAQFRVPGAAGQIEIPGLRRLQRGRAQLQWNTLSPLFSPRGETKCVRGPSVQGARRSAPCFLHNAGVLEQYVEHGEQAQRSNGGPMACFDRQVVRKVG